jgi:hypothetical protein
MSKQLIVEYIPFKPVGELNEKSGAAYGIPGGYVVQGILQRAGAKNQNGRVYPKNILMRECQRYQREYIDQHRALGELDHPESSVVNLNNVSHNVLKIWWNGDDLLGAVQILETPSGNILKSLFKAGITLGISSRGLGSVKELRNEGVVEVQEDFELICWDFVSNPSTQGAFMRPNGITESTNKNIATNKYNGVNGIITSILCEDGKCRI